MAERRGTAKMPRAPRAWTRVFNESNEWESFGGASVILNRRILALILEIKNPVW